MGASVPKKALSKLTDQEIARRVFSPTVRKQLKSVLTALDEPEKARKTKKIALKVKKQ